MPNIRGFKPLTDPNWISLEFDDGTISNPVNDPTGEYRKQVSEIAQKIAGVPPNPMAGATASLGGELTQGTGEAMARADVAAPLAAGPRTGAMAVAPVAPAPAPAAAANTDAGLINRALTTAMKPQPEGGMPPGGAAPGLGGASRPATPPQAPTGASLGPLVTTGTTSSWQRQKGSQTSTSGLAEADRPRVEAANEGAVKAAETANTEDYVSKATQYWHEFGRLSEDAKRQIAQRATLQEQERRFDESLNAAYRRLDETAARPVDPAQAFAGEKGWYAFMAGFGDVLRNVGSALAGKGPVADPGATLDALVERSVNLQMAQKKADYEAGRIGIDRLTADRETVRHRLGVVLQQLATTELAKAQTEQAYQGLGAVKAKGDAIVADARAKAAAATARQETTSTTDSQVSGCTTQRERQPAGGGASLEQLSKILDIEKKKLELRNAQLDSATTEDVSAAIGKEVSPERAKQLRDTVKENAVPLAKLGSFMQGMKEQLRINGATVNWETGQVQWPKDLSGVSAVKPSDVLGKDLGEAFNTNEDQLRKQMAFNKELLTTDTTGAVATPEQAATFEQVLGGAARNEDAYKSSVERAVKYLVSRRHGFLTAMGTEGSALYKATEDKLRNAQQAKMNELGTLPEGRR